MFNLTDVIIQNCIQDLKVGYRNIYGVPLQAESSNLLSWAATIALETIARSDAPYHDIEHTILVALTGQEILRGKHLQEGSVTSHDWLQFIISLLCHDIGYVKGSCHADDAGNRLYAIGVGDTVIYLPLGATDARLTPYHVDRSQCFVAETLMGQPLLDIERIQNNIELTRFPAPNTPLYEDTIDYPGLARAADLIGQLSDPRYLQKIPALFYEFEEMGTTEALGYSHPDDLRAGYPHFYRTVVLPCIKDALRHLKATQEGSQIVANLYANVFEAEQESLLSCGVA